MNKFQAYKAITEYKSKTYYTFMEQLNNWEDDQLMALSRAVVSFCELPTSDKLESITKLIQDANRALEFISKNIIDYIRSGNSDITENEYAVVISTVESLADSLRFEGQTVQDVLEDEAFNAALALELMHTS